MTSGFERSGVQLVLDNATYNRNIAASIASANELDASFADIIAAANEAESAISSVGGDVSVSVDVESDPAGLDEITTALDAIDGAEVTANAIGTADAEPVDALVTELAAVDGKEVTAKVNASVLNMQDLNNVITVLGQIGEVATKATLLIGGIAGAVATAAGAFAVQNFLDMDNALDSIEARTGRMIPEAEKLIMGIYEQGLGDSREQIAGVIIQMDHLGIATEDFQGAAETAFKAAEITGRPVEETLNTLNRLVTTGLSSGFEDAGDTLVTGFQEGADRAGDFFSTLDQNAAVLKDMGFDANTFTSTLINGLDGGFTSAGEVANSLITLRGRLSDNSQEVQDTLADIDLTETTDAYLAGQTTGEDFLRGLTEALDAIEDPAARLEATNTLFGRQARGFGADAIAGLGKIGTAMKDVEGRADAARDVLDRDFGESVQKTFRKLEDTVIGFLSSDQIDLPGKLAVFETQFQDFVDSLQQGEGLSRSIEIGFGLDQGSIGHIESLFNNIAISFMQAMQGVLSILGKGDEAAALGEEIGRIAGGQLQFDLGVVEGTDKLADSIATAVGRTGDWTPVITAVQGAVDEAVTSGNFGQAFDIVGAARDALATEGQHPELDLVFEQMGVRMADTLRPAFETALGEGNLVDAQSIADGMGDIDMQLAALELAEQLNASFTSAMETGDFDTAAVIAEQIGDPLLIQQVKDLGGSFGEVATEAQASTVVTSAALDDTTKAVTDYTEVSANQLDTNATDFETWSGKVTKVIDDVSGKVGALSGTIGGVNDAVNALGATPPEGATPLERRAGGGGVRARQTIIGGEDGAELFTAPAAGSIINAANSSALMSALSQILGGGGNTTNNYITLNSTMNAQNNAQADVFGSRLSRQVRGFA